MPNQQTTGRCAGAFRSLRSFAGTAPAVQPDSRRAAASPSTIRRAPVIN